MASQEIPVKVVIDAEDRTTSVVSAVEKKIVTLQKKVQDLQPVFKGMAATGGVALASIVLFSKGTLDAASESAAGVAQLGAVLKSTGGVAGVTADMATKLANSLQKQSAFTDEAILSGENLLLTFTNIGQDIFPQATQIITDMSQALGQDLKASAIQVGKALQDPILGVTALRRVGVNFNTAQTEVIKNLVNTGHAAEAQALILKELNTEFGGSAKAAYDALPPLEKMNKRFGEMQESVGRALLPVIEKFTEKIIPIIDKIAVWIEENPKLTGTIIIMAGSLALIVTVVGLVGMAMGALIPVATALGVTLGVLMGWMLIIPVAIAAVIAAGVFLYKHWDEVKVKVTEIWTAIMNFFTVVWDKIKTIFKFAVDFIIGLVVLGFKAMGIDIVGAMGIISKALTAVWDVVKIVWKAATDWLKKMTEGWGDSIKAIIQSVVSFITDKFKWITDKFDGIKKAAGNIFSTVGNAIGGAVNKVSSIGSGITGFANGGMVPGPVGAPMIAMVHGGEKVLTADEVRNGGNSGAIIINFNNSTITDDSVIQKIKDAMRRELQLNYQGIK